MKKSIILIMILLFSGMLIWNYNKNTDVIENEVKVKAINGEADQQSVAKKIIRFHILANSDSNEDQALKLKVRDKVLEYISPKLSNSKSIDESREILKKYDKNVVDIAQRVIKENGYNYSVKTELTHMDFPVKLYGNILLPQGRYEAYRILIGSAKGHNWWCVMFPPLCFTDITKGNVEPKKTQQEMKNVLTKEEYDLIDNSADKDISGGKSSSTDKNSNGNSNKDSAKSDSKDENNGSIKNNTINNNENKSKAVINKKNNENNIKSTQNKVGNNSNIENKSDKNISDVNEKKSQSSPAHDNNSSSNNLNNTENNQQTDNLVENKRISENRDQNTMKKSQSDKDNQKIIVKFKLVDEIKKLGNILGEI